MTDPNLPKNPLEGYSPMERQAFGIPTEDLMGKYKVTTTELISPPEFVQYNIRGWVRIRNISVVAVYEGRLLFWLEGHTASDDYTPVDSEYMDNFIKVLQLQNVDLTAK